MHPGIPLDLPLVRVSPWDICEIAVGYVNFKAFLEQEMWFLVDAWFRREKLLKMHVTDIEV